jgi:uridine kinase
LQSTSPCLGLLSSKPGGLLCFGLCKAKGLLADRLSQRLQMLGIAADRILRLPLDRTARVGIDGVDGAGKTMFADELAQVLRAADRPVIRASVDGFHRPKSERYRRGRGSPEGYFEDSYNYTALKTALLDPLGPCGTGRYRTAVFDHVRDKPVAAPECAVAPASILLLDGIFLHRPELRDIWDVSIFLDVAFEVSVARCARRDGTSPDPAAAANRRYVEGQMLYLRTCDPRARATLAIDNNDLSSPFILHTKD